MSDSKTIDALNKAFYLSDQAAAWYAMKQFVLPEEEAFLREFGETFRGGACLDIGIGAGRSTRFLLPLAGSYVGVDYSPEMIQAARAQFPQARLEVQDARDLSSFAADEFDLVMFSFNGMDCLSHEGRLKTLQEIRRVLKPRGLFAFSAHNRGRPSVSPLALGNLNRSKHPLRMLKHVREYLQGVRNWLKSRSVAVETEEFAMRPDSGNVFTVPMYYIDKAAQARQLREQGFELCRIYDSQGRTTSAGDADARSAWIFYVGRKGS